MRCITFESVICLSHTFCSLVLVFRISVRSSLSSCTSLHLVGIQTLFTPEDASLSRQGYRARERANGTSRRPVSAASRLSEINCLHAAPLLVSAADLTRPARRHDDFCDTSITALVLSSSRRCPMPLPFHPLRPTAMSISLDIFLCSVAVRVFGVHRMSLRFASLFRSSLVFASSHLVQGRLLG